MKGAGSRLVAVLALVSSLVLGLSSFSEARGGRRGGSEGPGTFSYPRSHSVRPYLRRGGTIVPGHRRSNPNHRFEDNWTTNPNVNPYTGRQGTRINPPRPR